MHLVFYGVCQKTMPMLNQCFKTKENWKRQKQLSCDIQVLVLKNKASNMVRLFRLEKVEMSYK